MNELKVAFAALMGLIIGSFLNVVVYRFPLGASLAYPPSSCPQCGHRLAPWENIPVISFALLRGRCHSCHQSISVRYPLVEIMTAAVFALVAWRFHSPLVVATICFFSSALIVLSVIDIDTRKLPRKIIYVAAPFSFAALVVAALVEGEPTKVMTMVLSALLGGAVFGIIHLARPKAMGMGDVRLAGYIGLNLGYFGVGAAVDFLYGAFLFGAIFGVLFALVKSKSMRITIPFGPFMALGAFVALFAYPVIHIF